MLKKLYIHEHLSFNEVDVELDDITLITGNNNTGKTILLKYIMDSFSFPADIIYLQGKVNGVELEEKVSQTNSNVLVVLNQPETGLDGQKQMLLGSLLVNLVNTNKQRIRRVQVVVETHSEKIMNSLQLHVKHKKNRIKIYYHKLPNKNR